MHGDASCSRSGDQESCERARDWMNSRRGAFRSARAPLSVPLMETCECCGAGVVYRFNARSTPDSAYVYVCLGAKHHVHADVATLRSDPRSTVPSGRRSRILERRPLRAGGIATA
jgi:hypothetical protein